MIRSLFENPRVPNDRKLLINADDPSTFVTHGQLKEQSLLIAAGLQHHFGLKKGEVVAIIAPNDIAIVALTLGILSAGGVVTTLDHFSDEDTLRHCLAVSDTRYIIVDPSILHKVLSVTHELSIPKERHVLFGSEAVNGIPSFTDVLITPNYSFNPVDLKPEDHASYMYTSGSTGPRKVVIINHGMMEFEKEIADRAIHPYDYDSILTNFLLTHSAAMGLALFDVIWNGKTMYLMKTFEAQDLCKYIQAYKASMVFILPFVVSSLARYPQVKEYDLTSLKVVCTSGAFLDASLAESFEESIGIKLINKYGMTEVRHVFTADAQSTSAGSVGKVIEGVQVKLMTNNGIEAKVGQVGELLVKAPHRTPGYYKNPEATANVIDNDGYLYTGDLFKYDSEGRYSLVSRKSELIRHFYTQFFPVELETIMTKHPIVADCAVIGVNSEKVGTEVARAYVELLDMLDEKGAPVTVTAEELADFVNAQVPVNMQLYGGVFILGKLPRTPVSKIDRPALRRMSQKDRERRSALAPDVVVSNLALNHPSPFQIGQQEQALRG